MLLHRQKGIAIIEMTMILPVMLLLIYATAEFGRALHQYNMLTQLTRDATRYITQPQHAIPTDSGVIEFRTDITDNTINMLLYGTTITGATPLLAGLSASDIAITEEPADTNIVVIRVTYNWTPILGDTLPTFGLGDDIDLSFNFQTAFAMRAL